MLKNVSKLKGPKTNKKQLLKLSMTVVSA